MIEQLNTRHMIDDIAVSCEAAMRVSLWEGYKHSEKLLWIGWKAMNWREKMDFYTPYIFGDSQSLI